MAFERAFPRPRVVISRCIDFDACRYNGQVIRASLREQLEPHFDFVPICPELEIGLGVPRDPVRLVRGDGSTRMLQPATGRDLTQSMNGWSRDWLSSTGAVDGFILKAKSPSCGVGNAKLYDSIEAERPSGRSAGLFTAAVAEVFPHVAVVDEGRLRDKRLREHFLTKLYVLADYRSVIDASTPRALSDFQARNKLVLMAYNQTRMRAMGRIASNSGEAELPKMLHDYGLELAAAMSRPPRPASNINVLMHALGYVSDRLSPNEKAQFLDTLEDYRSERVPLSAPQAVIASWLARFDVPYLSEQTYFAPFPRELVT